MNSPPAPVSRSIWASTVLFSRVVLHIMGVINVINCFPILATNTVKIVSDSDVGTDRLPKNPLPLSLLGLLCFFLRCSCPSWGCVSLLGLLRLSFLFLGTGSLRYSWSSSLLHCVRFCGNWSISVLSYIVLCLLWWGGQCPWCWGHVENGRIGVCWSSLPVGWILCFGWRFLGIFDIARRIERSCHTTPWLWLVFCRGRIFWKGLTCEFLPWSIRSRLCRCWFWIVLWGFKTGRCIRRLFLFPVWVVVIELVLLLRSWQWKMLLWCSGENRWTSHSLGLHRWRHHRGMLLSKSWPFLHS